MIKRFVILMVVFVTLVAVSGDKATDLKVIREGIEWCDVWIPSANSEKMPKVLLVGDSIVKGYYNSASKHLKDKVVCARFATSACISDPAFHAQLAAVLNGYKYDVIHFNNGLHGTGYTEKEYREGYEMALEYIKKQAPDAKLVLALSTPLQSTINRNDLNPRSN